MRDKFTKSYGDKTQRMMPLGSLQTHARFLDCPICHAALRFSDMGARSHARAHVRKGELTRDAVSLYVQGMFDAKHESALERASSVRVFDGSK
jgi:hypothetical protein